MPVAVLLAGLGACSTEPGRLDTDPDHGNLACATCHRGELADRGMASVPAASCASGDCHGGAVPDEVHVATVTFEHRSHGAGSGIALGCAGCHSHDVGSQPLTGSTDACGLCHADQQSGEGGQDCGVCHGHPEHVTLTSQGLPVPHQSLPWISRACVRCHYDVTDPTPQVSMARCAACHQGVQALAGRAIGEDLHPDHSGLACTSCHESEPHRIVAMSSAVDLSCVDCHREGHDVELSSGWPSETCNACHREVHQDQQRLVLGSVGSGVSSAPAEKFMDGLVCRSCHLPGPSAEEPASVSGSPRACVACHEPEYATVLDWWEEGLDQRLRVVGAYVDQARRSLDGSPQDSVEVLLGEAGDLLALLDRAGGQHNLRLAHELFRESLARTRRAWTLAGRTPPESPGLGRAPNMGVCSYCHYRLDDPWEFQTMPEAFHIRVMSPGGR